MFTSNALSVRIRGYQKSTGCSKGLRYSVIHHKASSSVTNHSSCRRCAVKAAVNTGVQRSIHRDKAIVKSFSSKFCVS